MVSEPMPTSTSLSDAPAATITESFSPMATPSSLRNAPTATVTESFSPLELVSIPDATAVGRASRLAWPELASLATDMLFVGVNGVLVFYLRFFHNGHPDRNMPIGHYAGFLVVYGALVGIFSHSRGLYRPIRHLAAPLDESHKGFHQAAPPS